MCLGVYPVLHVRQERSGWGHWVPFNANGPDPTQASQETAPLIKVFQVFMKLELVFLPRTVINQKHPPLGFLIGEWYWQRMSE